MFDYRSGSLYLSIVFLREFATTEFTNPVQHHQPVPSISPPPRRNSGLEVKVAHQSESLSKKQKTNIVRAARRGASILSKQVAGCDD
jgi:hypothetical protein